MTPPLDASPAEKANILLVDDQPANLLALEAALADLGQNLVRATSGEEALRRLLAQDFAVVLLDLNMPGLDGFTTAELIRGRERSRHLPIVFLTAQDSAAFPPEKAYTLGAVDYLVKPVPAVILRAKAAVFVALFHQARRLQHLEEERHRHELAEQSRREEERFRLVAENVQDFAIFLLDPSGAVTSWNAGAERILGYRAAEVVGRQADRFFTPEDITAGRLGRELREAEQTGRSANDCWLVRKDGSRFWASGVTTALRTSGLGGFVKIFRDLSERRKLEEELRRRAEGLAEAARRKDEFLTMLAHELRNPLGVLRSSLHLLHMPGTDPAVRGRSTEVAERQVSHLARIVDDLLDVSRIARGAVVPRRERVDLARLVRQGAEDYRGLIEQAGLTLTVQSPPLPLWVNADPTRLTQVLGSLLENAAKFTPAGGRVEVRAAAEPVGREAAVMVRDTGAGVGPDLLPQVWEPFTQADRSLDRAKGGLGLGLALVKGLVEAHGGRVEAHSAGPGRGAEFIFRLPLEPEPRALQPAAPPARAAAPGLRVLVAEDNRDAAELLRVFLGMLGHQVEVAYSGPAAVAAAHRLRPQVVLCDIGLPGLDGYGVARELRRHPDTAAARLIAVTGYGAEEDRRRSKEAGFAEHLVKPVRPEELQRVLTRTK
jgi:PAS domain S-box-containing protein